MNAFFSGAMEDVPDDAPVASGELEKLFEKYKAIGIQEGAVQGSL